MGRDMLIVFGVLALLAVLFASNRVRSDIAALSGLLVLQLTGVLTIPESLAGFADPVVLVIISMFIISEALSYTGIAQKIGTAVLRAGRGDETRLIALLMLVIGVVGAFMNSTTVMAIFMPVALSVARKAELNTRRLLMPLSVAALISGMMTLIATAPNLIVDKALVSQGYDSLSFFGFTPFGIAVLAVGILFMLVFGRQILARERRKKPRRKKPTVYELVKSYGLAGHVHGLAVPAGSPVVDRAVARFPIKQTFDLHIVAFEKQHFGRRYFEVASPQTVFETGDEIIVLGDQEQVDRMAEIFKLEKIPEMLPFPNVGKREAFLRKVGLAEIMLGPESKLIGKTLKSVQFQTRYKVTVVAVRRRGVPITHEVGDLILDFGDALLVNGRWPDILSLREEQEDFVVLTVPEEVRDYAPASKRALWVIGILSAMVVAMASGLLTTVTAAMVAVLFLIATRCVRLETIYRVVRWRAVVLIAAVLPLATALEKSGVTGVIASTLANTFGSVGPTAMLAIVFLLTAFTAFFISNTATAVLIAPIAINVAEAIGSSPHAFAMTVAIACSAAYVTPISSPVNMLVLEPGGYSYIDFVKAGVPLLFLTMIATVALCGLIYLS